MRNNCITPTGVLFTLLLICSMSGSLFGRAAFDADNSKFTHGSFSTVTYAHCIADHRVGKIVLAINNNGTFGDGFRMAGGGDCFTGQEIRSCEYPKGSRVEYLFAGAFWIGAIVGRDTLVSVGADGWSFAREFNPDPAPFGNMYKRSIIDPSSPLYDGAISEEDFIAIYTDTFTAGVEPDYFGASFKPLYIEVREASYAWSYAYAEDFVLFDYEIKNIGTAPLEEVYMGLYVDGDVCFDCDNSGGYADDITGFLQTIPTEFKGTTFIDTVNAAWLADNDGDLNAVTPFKPAPDVTAMRIVRTPSEDLQVSYNWWISNGSSSLDFGPRERSGVGRLQEPFRDFRTGGLGTPEGDVNKYYIMSNREFDYDQAWVASIQPNDTLWLYPTQDNVDEWATGLDTRYLLSFGPFHIEPGQTLPLSLAYIAGEDFHTDPNNIDNLPGNPSEFYANLNFKDLGLNSRWASWIYDNPGVDTDGDGYAGEFRISIHDTAITDSTMHIDTTTFPPDTFWTYKIDTLLADTQWYIGDGVPDFKGATPPPAPYFWVEPAGKGKIRIRFNGTYSETVRDIFSQQIDFEGYRIYISRDNRSESYSVITSYDIEDYNKYVFDSTSGRWIITERPFRLDELRTIYNDSTFEPLSYTRSTPFSPPGFPDSAFYFEPQDYNASELGGPGMIRKVYPEQPYPSTLIPDSAQPEELTEDGLFKYFEYEYTITGLLSTVEWWINVTAFDYGSPESGLPALETSVSVGAKNIYAQSSVADVTLNNLDVYVYPNPYRFDGAYRAHGFEGRSATDRPDDRVRAIHFANLPAKCKISIYTIDGDLVKEILHDKDPSDPTASHDSWDMITRNTQLVVSGLYYWTVESEGRETQIGKLAIIM